MITRKRVAVLLVFGLLLAIPGLVSAGGPPSCAPLCPPSPPPATTTQAMPAPAATQTGVPPEPAVDLTVKLAPVHVHPGEKQTLKVSAGLAPHAYVRTAIHWAAGPPLVKKAHLDAKGKLTQSWQTPDKAEPGKAKVTVLVRSKPISLNKTVTLNFTVQK